MSESSSNPAIETVGDLYSVIDWSQADKAGLEVQNAEIEVDPEFKRRYRLTLLDEGIWGEGPHRDTARTLLNSVGVWKQVVKYLTAL